MTAVPPSSAPVQPGDVLAGKYRVDRILGQGGMGVVVAATHTHLGQKVALKFLLPELAARQDIVARFDREARAAVRIQSEHVARVLDTGVLESGAPYMVMEFLEGSDLQQLVRQRGRLEVGEAVGYVLQACECLAEAHVAGIVHRDLKPANLFLTRRADGSPLVKVLDFGISKANLLGAAAGAQPLTQTAAMMGSPKYMSPEQLKSARDVDARTDIWALGVVLHELLTGEAAFLAPTMAELCMSILGQPPPPLRSRRQDAPAGLEAVILRCLEKEPARRFANVAELAVALGEFAPHARVSVERVLRVLQASGQATHLGLPPATHAPAPQAAHAPAPQVAVPQTVAATLGGSAAPAAAPPPTHPPTAVSPGAAQHPYAQQAYAAPPQGHAPPMPAAGAYAPGYGPPMAAGYGPPPQPQASLGYPTGPGPAPAPRSGLHPSTIALIVIGLVVVLGMGSCTLCVCLSAAAQ